MEGASFLVCYCEEILRSSLFPSADEQSAMRSIDSLHAACLQACSLSVDRMGPKLMPGDKAKG